MHGIIQTNGHLRGSGPPAPARPEVRAGDHCPGERLHSQLRKRQTAGARGWLHDRHRRRRLRGSRSLERRARSDGNRAAAPDELQPRPGRRLRQRPHLRRTTQRVCRARGSPAPRLHLRRRPHFEKHLQGRRAGRVRLGGGRQSRGLRQPRAVSRKPTKFTPKNTRKSSRSCPFATPATW